MQLSQILATLPFVAPHQQIDHIRQNAVVALRIRVSRDKELGEMSLLPMSTPPRATSPANGSSRGKSAISKLKILLRRAINVKQMVSQAFLRTRTLCV